MSDTGLNGSPQRFLTLAEAAEILNCEVGVIRDLVSSGELAAFRIGARGDWRIEHAVLERFIQDQYELQRRTAAFENAEFSDLPELSGGRIINW